MSVAARVFRGYGNGTVIGSVDERVHRGYISGVAVITPDIDGRVKLTSSTLKHTTSSSTVAHKMTSKTGKHTYL